MKSHAIEFILTLIGLVAYTTLVVSYIIAASQSGNNEIICKLCVMCCTWGLIPFLGLGIANIYYFAKMTNKTSLIAKIENII